MSVKELEGTLKDLEGQCVALERAEAEREAAKSAIAKLEAAIKGGTAPPALEATYLARVEIARDEHRAAGGGAPRRPGARSGGWPHAPGTSPGARWRRGRA